jgi:signal transduction histidine kinase/CheY-like chemotaxis protein
VLLLEDDVADALLIEQALLGGLPGVRIARAADRRDYLRHLADGGVDVVLADGDVPGCEGVEALYRARGQDPRIAFLFVTGARPDLDDRALAALGVAGLVSKDELERLVPAVSSALAARDEPAWGPEAAPGLEVLLTATRAMARAQDLAELSSIAQAAARRLSGADGATFAIRDGDDCHYTDEDPPGPRWKGLRFPLGECLSGWAMQHRQPVVVDEVGTDDRVPRGAREAPVSSAVVVPIRSQRPVAALGTYWSAPFRPDRTRVRLLQALADSAADALESLQSRRVLQARAGQNAAELTALTYAVSHDLRAPIRHLEGFARILIQDAESAGAPIRHAAGRIEDAAVHLRQMVDGLLALSRIGSSEVHPQPVDLAEVGRTVARALAAAEPEGTDRGAPVEFVAPEHLPTTGDPRLLQTALQDLLANAWKFTARVPRPRVELGARPPDPGSGTPVEYFVRDNGAGFEPGSADRLFGAFQRLHPSDDYPGAGVGLASVKRIVAKHGGTVRATGTPEGGATFFFTLPGAPESD